MTDPAAVPAQGQGRYQNGVWMSKAEGSRAEKYTKWTEERTKSKVKHLDKQKHSFLVKLNSECLQVRTELRGLQQDRRQPSHHHHHHLQHVGHFRRKGSKGPTTAEPGTGEDSATRSGVVSVSSEAPASPRTTSSKKTPSSSSSLASTSTAPLSPGASYPTSQSSYGSASASSLVSGGLKTRAAALNTGPSAMKLRNLHSSRALSKLNHNMDISK